jgi:hypothetical protein
MVLSCGYNEILYPGTCVVTERGTVTVSHHVGLGSDSVAKLLFRSAFRGWQITAVFFKGLVLHKTLDVLTNTFVE